MKVRGGGYIVMIALLCGGLSFSTPVISEVSGTSLRSPIDCSALSGLSSKDLKVETARLEPAGQSMPGPSGAPLQLPEHCLVRGVLAPRTGVGGQPFGMGFELRLPSAWNGRFLFQGGGGLDGVIRPALGFVSAATPAALARGFSVVSTDAGHEGMDATFAFDRQARIDYAYNAVDKVTLLAKSIIQAYYGRPADHAYFMGCSNGGRQGMIATQRLPLLFDGVVVGDPGFRLSRAAIEEMWDTVQFSKASPKDSGGAPILSQALTPADLNLVSQAVLKACDALDGLADGIINDVRRCRFDPARLRCRIGQSSACLTPNKIQALKAVFGGAHDSRGAPLYADWPYDAGIAAPGWRAWKLGSSASGGAPDALNATLGLMSERYYFSTPPDPALQIGAYDFDTATARSAGTGAINDATSTMLNAFIRRGGRLLIYQGMSDPVFSANDIIRWYESLAQVKENGETEAWARLFLVPGMTHCSGGPSTDQFDALAAIQRWVEGGRPPERLIATGESFPGVTRPLCPYPRMTAYTGGDPKREASFACRR